MRAFFGLWNERDFLKLWTGQTVSRFGTTITGTALQLTALLLLGASPFQMGLLVAAAAAPTLLVGPFVGVFIDRTRRRPLMVAADLLRALLLASIPIAAAFGSLHLEQLLAVAAVVGVLALTFEVAQQSYVPELARERLLEANAKLGISDSLAEVTGTGIAGVLVQFLTAPVAILVDCVTYLISAMSLIAIRAPEAPSGCSGRESGAPIAGAMLVLRLPVLRALAAHAATDSFFGNFIGALYTIYCIRDLGMDPVLLGFSISIGGIGNLVGATVVGRTVGRWGIGSTTLIALAVSTAASLLLPAAGGPVPLAFAVIAVSQIVGDAGRSVYEVAALSVRQAVTPSPALGRVNTAMYLMVAGVGPLGALVGGYLGGLVGTRQTLVIAVAGLAVGKLWVVLSPVREIEHLQAAVTEL